MKTLEVRRHTMRAKPNLHISPEGIALTKTVAISQSKFDYVVTSDLERAIQTAEAMGQKVNHTEHDLGFLPKTIYNHVGWPVALEHVAQSMSDPATNAYAQNQLAMWQNIITQTPQNGHALIITHGLIIELAMVACMPNAMHKDWGQAIGYCEGIRLTFDDNKFTKSEILRVPKEHYNAEN
ncbi:MAG: phosphoglycerate mutase family protein [Alphaproteobacteria bacterium]|nr:phosphoglycerate mutase family protein [Alphaproteobacteria bacterium]